MQEPIKIFGKIEEIKTCSEQTQASLSIAIKKEYVGCLTLKVLEIAKKYCYKHVEIKDNFFFRFGRINVYIYKTGIIYFYSVGKDKLDIYREVHGFLLTLISESKLELIIGDEKL